MMKRLAILLVICLVTLAVIPGPALAKAEKVDLIPCPVYYTNNPPPPPGGGFVVFNDSAGPDNLEVTVSLKGVLNNTYEIYLFVDGVTLAYATLEGTVTTDEEGNANFHFNTAVTPGTHTLHIMCFAAPRSLTSDRYETPGMHPPLGGTILTFK